jgi:lysozyme family protein
MKQSITVIKSRESSLPPSTYIPASGALQQQPLGLEHPRQPQADEEEAYDDGDEEDEYSFEQSVSDALSASRASSVHSASLNSQLSEYDSEPLLTL